MAAGDFNAATEVVKQTIHQAAQVEDPLSEWNQLVFTNKFLFICATYKLCLWQYCVWYAIPKTGSSVLVALAGDKRNDCVCTYSVIIITFLAKFLEETISTFMDIEHVDPLVSLIMSSVIIYMWLLFIMEEAAFLSCMTCEDEWMDPLQRTVDVALNNNGSGFSAEIKAYYSSHKRTVEVDLVIPDGRAEFNAVQKSMGQVQKLAMTMDDVERAIVVPKSPSEA